MHRGAAVPARSTKNRVVTSPTTDPRPGNATTRPPDRLLPESGPLPRGAFRSRRRWFGRHHRRARPRTAQPVAVELRSSFNE